MQVMGNATMLITAGLVANEGLITLSGGTFDNNHYALNNSGQISGHGTIATGGLNNKGAIGISFGDTDLIGDINNMNSVVISGAAQATFHDDYVNNGTTQVSEGSKAVFLGAVSGAGGYTGKGSVFFEGDLRPGNSPALINVEGDMFLGEESFTTMELGGVARGDAYDAFDVGGTLSLNGALNVALYDLGGGLFTPSLGDSFDLFAAETIFGSFALVNFADLGDNIKWQLNYLFDADGGTTDILRLNVVSAAAVPEPASMLLIGSGLVGLLGMRRKLRG